MNLKRISFESQSIWLAPLLFGAAGILVWEGLLWILNPDGFLLPRPSEILTAFFEDFDQIWDAFQTTGYIAASGLLAGVILGVVMALLVTRFRTANEMLTPLAVAINAIPIIALAPLFNNWVGLTSPRSNQAVVVLLVFFPVFVNTAKGLTQVDPEQLELMDSYAAKKRTVLRLVRVPNALPFFFTALKIVSSLAVIAAIVVEYFGGRQNALGPLILKNAQFTRYDSAWAAVLAGVIFGISLYFAAAILERIASSFAEIKQFFINLVSKKPERAPV